MRGIMAEVVLKKGQGRSLKAGGLWVYDNEVDKITGEFSDGDFVDVLDFDGYFLGKGFINTKSKIIRSEERRVGKECS